MNDLESNPLAFAAAGPAEAADAAGAEPVAGVAKAAVPGWSDRVCRALVDRALAPMTRGRLELRLPGGGLRRYGSGAGGPAAEMVVRRERFFRRCVLGGDIGFGEAYQEGDWDTPDLAAVVGWFCANVEQAPTLSGSQRGPVWYANLGWWVNRLRHRWNRNSESGSRRNIHAHYDLGNEFYALWLDATMTYSAALFRRADQPLEQAQSAKYERLCRQLRLTAGDHVLEIGSGWGGFAEHAIRHHGCRVTSVTISPAQQRYAAARLARAGMGDRAEIRLEDYRRLTGQFDKIVSIEMLEAVGDEYLEAYFGKVQSLLRRDGRFAAQFITCPDPRHAEFRRGVDWIQKHIFPGSLLLSLNRVGQAVQRTGDLWLEDLHDLGLDYARTLRTWRERFNARLEEVRRQGFDERFVRSWNYYLAYCEAAFASRNISVVQATWGRPNSGGWI